MAGRGWATVGLMMMAAWSSPRGARPSESAAGLEEGPGASGLRASGPAALQQAILELRPSPGASAGVGSPAEGGPAEAASDGSVTGEQSIRRRNLAGLQSSGAGTASVGVSGWRAPGKARSMSMPEGAAPRMSSGVVGGEGAGIGVPSGSGAEVGEPTARCSLRAREAVLGTPRVRTERVPGPVGVCGAARGALRLGAGAGAAQAEGAGGAGSTGSAADVPTREESGGGHMPPRIVLLTRGGSEWVEAAARASGAAACVGRGARLSVVAC